MKVRKAHGWLVAAMLFTVASTAQEAVQVMTTPFSEASFHPTFEAPATVFPRNDSQISAEAAGLLLKVQAEAGQYVEAGQTLAVLDCRQSKLSAERAEGDLAILQAQLKLARLQLTRARQLIKDEHISEEIYDQRESDVAVLEGRIQVARTARSEAALMVEKCEIIAPFNGYVVERTAQKGQMAQPGSVLFRLVETLSPDISAQPSMSLLRSLEQGVDLAFVWNETSYPVKMKYNPNLVNPRTRSREVRLSFTADAAPPGATGRLVWKASWQALPAHLVVKRGDQLGVMLAENETAVFHALEGAVEGRPARADLDPDTAIITEGRLGLNHKDAILIR